MELKVVDIVEEESIKLALAATDDTGFVLVIAKNSDSLISEINPQNINEAKASQVKLVSVACMKDFLEVLSLIAQSKIIFKHIVITPLFSTNTVSQECLVLSLLTELVQTLDIPTTFITPCANPNISRICSR